jgi:signal transduction histidine kinase
MVRRDDRDYVRCIFRDSGEGIAPEDIDNICDPFFSTKPKGQGTGLGLSISFGIVKSCGGEISFDSIKGEYTAVMVDLPVV